MIIIIWGAGNGKNRSFSLVPPNSKPNMLWYSMENGRISNDQKVFVSMSFTAFDWIFSEMHFISASRCHHSIAICFCIENCRMTIKINDFDAFYYDTWSDAIKQPMRDNESERPYKCYYTLLYLYAHAHHHCHFAHYVHSHRNNWYFIHCDDIRIIEIIIMFNAFCSTKLYVLGILEIGIFIEPNRTENEKKKEK